MAHRLAFTCQRTGAVVIRDYSGDELALLYTAQMRAELADGRALHIRWSGMEPEHITIHDTSVPQKHPFPPRAFAATPDHPEVQP